jgi:hypothetical protein
MNHPLLNILVGGHSIVPDASVQEECRMTALPDCLLIVTAEVDASVEADWNRWYDDVHLPDALACPGVRAGRRYVSSGEVSESDRGQGKRTGAKLYIRPPRSKPGNSKPCAAGVAFRPTSVPRREPW